MVVPKRGKEKKKAVLGVFCYEHFLIDQSTN